MEKILEHYLNFKNKKIFITKKKKLYKSNEEG